MEIWREVIRREFLRMRILPNSRVMINLGSSCNRYTAGCSRPVYFEAWEHLPGSREESPVRLQGMAGGQIALDERGEASRANRFGIAGAPGISLKGIRRIVVARDGIEPPTPAFSGPRSTTELPGQWRL